MWKEILLKFLKNSVNINLEMLRILKATNIESWWIIYFKNASLPLN